MAKAKAQSLVLAREIETAGKKSEDPAFQRMARRVTGTLRDCQRQIDRLTAEIAELKGGAQDP